MTLFRAIPLLLIENEECIKTINYKKKIYLGDPINIIKIYNDLGVDEIIILDISSKNSINFKKLQEISSESFIPLTYGGGVSTLKEVEKILSLGFEKISFNNKIFEDLNFVENVIKEFGSSSVSISFNIKKNFFGKDKIFIKKKNKYLDIKIDDYLSILNTLNTAEVIINFVDLEGTRKGYNKKLACSLRSKILTNVLVNGGAKDINDFIYLKNENFSGAVASSIFSFVGLDQGVLINYFNSAELELIHKN